jgi:DNA-binding SARP family transcriptional activator
MNGFNARHGDGDITLPGAVQRLVAFLALHERRPLQRSYVAGKLWFETSDGRASASLRTALCRLRHSDAPLIEASRSTLRLAADVCVDVNEQAALARRVLAAPDDFADIECQVLLAGVLLPDWHDTWVVFERERIRQLRLHALEAVAERLTTHGRYGEAVEVALAALREEPLRESAHHALMRAYLAEGNIIEAVTDYCELEELLRRRFGICPCESLRQLVSGFEDACRSVRVRVLSHVPAPKRTEESYLATGAGGGG